MNLLQLQTVLKVLPLLQLLGQNMECVLERFFIIKHCFCFMTYNSDLLQKFTLHNDKCCPIF
jgi:hypothetical protein